MSACIFLKVFDEYRNQVMRDLGRLDNHSRGIVSNLESFKDEELWDIGTLEANVEIRDYVLGALFERIIMGSEISDEILAADVFDFIIDSNPYFLISICSYISGLCIKILNESDIDDLKLTKVFYLINRLESRSIPPNLLSPIASFIKLKLSSEITKVSNLIFQSGSPQNHLNTFELISRVNIEGVSIIQESNLLVSICLDIIITNLDLYNFKPKERSNPDISQISQQLSYIKLVKSLNSLNTSKLFQIESFINQQALVNPSEPQATPNPLQADLRHQNQSLGIINQVKWRARSIYHRTLNEFSISVTLGSLPSNDLIAKKVYQFPSGSNYESLIQNEIETLKKLSSRASKSNCFLKFYGSTHNKNCVEIFMEAHEKTLTNLINERNGLELDLITAKKFINNLLQFFAELANIGIIHQDIKPSNILVTKDLNLKVIDFGTAGKIESSDVTEVHDVKGTKTYMAPELLGLYEIGSNSGAYRPEKSDVYSLGVTFFEMISAGLVSGLPGGPAGFRSEFKRYVSQLGVDLVVKSLLTRMLEPNYHLRPDFRACIDIVNCDATEMN